MPLLFALSLVLAACTIAPDAGPPDGPPPAAPATDYEATLSRILQAVLTSGGLVDYDRLRTDFQPEFDSVKAAVETYPTADLTTDAEKLAFFMNAYNVTMLSILLDAPEVMNIETEGRFEDFFQSEHRIAGLNMTLNQLENGILRGNDVVDGLEIGQGLRDLRPSALDPRIHVGLNCGAVSCPPLRRDAFTPEAVNAQLDTALVEWLASARFLNVEDGVARLSSIVNWFGEDFEVGGEAAGDYLLGGLPTESENYLVAQNLLEGRTAAEIRTLVNNDPTVTFFYDWTVNRAN